MRSSSTKSSAPRPDKNDDGFLDPVEVYKSAVLSACGTYRYELRRTWHEAEKKLIFIGLNPSTADASNDDPTIRKCVGFARRWGFGGIIMLNLFAFRATDPRDLKVNAESAIGPQNDYYLDAITRMPGTATVCAWGAHGSLLNRDAAVLEMLSGVELECLGRTKDGSPRHPLYLPYSITRQYLDW